MGEPSETLVICDNVACPIHESMITLGMLSRIGVQLPDMEAAKTSKIPCRACTIATPKREGYLIYVPVEEFATVGAAQSTYPVDGPVDGPVYGPVNPWERIPRQENTAVPSDSEATASHDPNAQPTGGVPVGVVLDVIPYGGYILRYQDTDEGMNYGPRQEELPRQDPAKPNYVLQLQDDLIFLCYWNTFRAEPMQKKKDTPKQLAKASPGEFHYSMMGSILALKEDLHTFYGVPTTTTLNDTKISLSQGAKLSLEGLNLPILYDPELRNPIFRLFDKVLDPIEACRKTALSVADGWSGILKRLNKGKIVNKNDRKQLARFVEKSLAALVACDQALDKAKSVGGKQSTPASATVLLADPAFEIDRVAGKKNWKGFEVAVTNWEALRTKLEDKIHACLSSLNTYVPAADEDPDVVAGADELRTSYGQLVVSLEAAYTLGWDLLGGIPSVLSEYSAKLRKYAVVDWATASYIHAMRYGIPIGGTGAIKRSGGLLAFRLPDEGIDVGVSHDVDELYPMAIEAARDMGVPPAFVLERFGVESGFEHTFTLKSFSATKAHKGVKLPKMGPDYANW